MVSHESQATHGIAVWSLLLLVKGNELGVNAFMIIMAYDEYSWNATT